MAGRPNLGKSRRRSLVAKTCEVLPASIEVLDISQCEPDILDQVRELLEQRQHGERSNFLLLKKIIIEFVAKENSAVAPEQARELRRVEEWLIADEKEVGVEVVHPSFRMGGSAIDFEAAFHFDIVVSSLNLKHQ
jgi:hypothetical protein